MKENN